jgi:hypothetical protein
MRQSSIALKIGGVSMVGTSMTTSFISDPQNLVSIYAYSIQVVWSGGAAPVGTFSLQGSDDPGDIGSGQAVSLPVNWTNITSSPQAISGTPGSILYDVVECSYRWVRLVYTAVSGSATVTAATINVKGV